MSRDEEGRQMAITGELAQVARSLARSTRTVPRPSDSYDLLDTLCTVQESLAQVYAQLASWHGAAVGGTHYDGGDVRSIPGAPAVGADGHATHLLKMAAASATETAELINSAYSANNTVRWFDEVKKEEGARA